jgi:hypothetical protein
MKNNRLRIDTVRASRDGHEFHEAWAARKALQLVMPTDELVGIAVEGLAPADQTKASAETVEIADLVLYYGTAPTFDWAKTVVILQAKYSISLQSVPFRASDGKKTIRKFAAALRSHKRTHGAKAVEKKLAFELITNRPIYIEFAKAIDGLASGTPLKGNAKRQAAQFTSASGLKGKELTQFAMKLRITGLSGSLRQNKQNLSRALADWSVAPDAMARARLGNLRQMLRDKAGLAGAGQNVITRTDVLDALELQGPEDLFPCPTSFPDVGKIVKREQLSAVVSRIPQLDKPLMIHADGGAGKTVFLQSVAKVLSETHETVLFDCFGGGAYRAPEDGRHLPKRGLIHIINNLARDGLCDPLLPINENVEDLVKAFRTRLAQAVATLRRGSPDRQILLFIDAVDNAAEHAKDKSELAFPTLLLESFYHGGGIPGVQLIVSCRTYRRAISRGALPAGACEELLLRPFSPGEAKKYLRDRIPGVTDVQIHVAYSRSEGNPRILEHLALSDRGLLDPSQINNVIKLDDLLKERIRQALAEALKRGYEQDELNAFLAGLSVLPPPVPLEEYADAHGLDVSAIRSFAADLAPLLEQTRYGLMFRDEPTETLVREDYAAREDTLRLLADNLFKKQATSVYAASALPGLLQKLDDARLLFDLAFDERFPAEITSTVGKQNIRYARLKAAVRHASRKADYDRLVHLLVELSTIAAVNERGTDYVLDNPDLVIASHDVDATRRLFETRTRWAGTRYARITIASVLAGDLSDAYRYVVHADEWIHHFYAQSEDYRIDRGGPEKLDLASVPLCLVAQDRGPHAAQWMKFWKDWSAYEISEHLFTLLEQAEQMGAASHANIWRFLDSLSSQLGVLAGALSFLQLDNAASRRLVQKLSKSCEDKRTVEASQQFYSERDYLIEDGLLKAAAIAVGLKMHKEAQVISKAISNQRPNLWTFTDRLSNKDAFRFITFTAMTAAAEGRIINEHLLLPSELVEVGARVADGIQGDAFRKSVKAELEEPARKEEAQPDEKKPRMSYDTRRAAERFIDDRLAPLLDMAQALSAVLASRIGKADESFLDLVELWTKYRIKYERYSEARERDLFFDLLGRQLLTFSVWARNDLNSSSVKAFVSRLIDDRFVPISALLQLIPVLSKRVDLQELAGRLAKSVKAMIEAEDDVSQRASLFARLSRAIMPASIEETATYFRLGLEQMDAIGSGDYQFTSELLTFAAGLRGDEFEEADFHTLSNICELNIYDQEKFPWLDFGRALARTSGCRSLARLARWDDREKSSLNYTLLPYLSALLEQDKIDPSIALGLLRVSLPVEFYVCGTEQLAELIAKKQYPNSEALLTEAILQFEQNHPGVFMPGTLETLRTLAERELGKDAELTIYLSTAAPKFKELRDENNENRNYRRPEYSSPATTSADEVEENRRAFEKIVNETDPSDEASLSRAIDALNVSPNSFSSTGELFDELRRKLKYSDRPQYVRTVARLEALGIYAKLDELKRCKAEWAASSSALEEAFLNIGIPFIQSHADDLVHHDYLSNPTLKDISELCGIPVPKLVLELILVFVEPNSHLPASLWMSLATIVCQKAAQGEGQVALKRLLNSNAAKLSSTVVDGLWKEGLYPKANETDIAAGLVWRSLGSPYAAQRWMAAHSVRCFARFRRWDVILALMQRFYSTEAHPYQAPELPFYFLHARLWLLIATARMAIDYPTEVAQYADTLKAIALDQSSPHVLMRDFAARALLACADRGAITLSAADVQLLGRINKSPFSTRTTKTYVNNSFYESRPASMPEPEREFSLDFDFDKNDVTEVSGMFGQSRWETRDAITARVRNYDANIESMHETGGRSVRERDRYGMTTRYHTYGQQLGWHALYVVAGEFLAKYRIVRRSYDPGNRWDEWIQGESITRKDGLWLADGVDLPPLDAQLNLYEQGEKGRVLTGDKAKLLSLLKIDSLIADELVVAGSWQSSDGIEIRITSALSPIRKAKELATELSHTDPFRAWLPRYEQHDGSSEYSRSEKEPWKPWVVWPSREAGLDKTDPLSITAAVHRPYFSKSINAISSLAPRDPFKRAWVDPHGRLAVRSEAWGRNPSHEEGDEISAERLVCSSIFLKDVLIKRRSSLLVLIVLRRYDKGSSSRDSQYWHTTAVVRIGKTLDFEFFPGLVNQLHVTKY